MVVNEFYEKNTSGIFALLAAKDVPWKNIVDATVLDNSYRYMHATNLICSSLCDTLDISLKDMTPEVQKKREKFNRTKEKRKFERLIIEELEIGE